MKKIAFVTMGALMLACSMTGCKDKNVDDNKVMDHYEITIACQKEASEEGVVKALINAYTAKNPKVVINLETFAVAGYESYMNGISELEKPRDRWYK